jgi:hypothetical protein
MFLRLRKVGEEEDDKEEIDGAAGGSTGKDRNVLTEASSGMPASKVHKTFTNQATNVAAFPPVWQKSATPAEKDAVVSVLAKVALYANENLKLNGTLKSGPHAHKDDVGMHLGIFAIYEYQPDQSGRRSRVYPHSDSNYEGRCLSAGLHLDNWFDDNDDKDDEDGDGGGEHENDGIKNPKSSEKTSANKQNALEHNTPIVGGELLMHECADGLLGCVEDGTSTGFGDKLASLHDDGVFVFADGAAGAGV